VQRRNLLVVLLIVVAASAALVHRLGAVAAAAPADGWIVPPNLPATPSPDDPAGPYGPHRPTATARPATWPGGSGEAAPSNSRDPRDRYDSQDARRASPQRPLAWSPPRAEDEDEGEAVVGDDDRTPPPSPRYPQTGRGPARPPMVDDQQLPFRAPGPPPPPVDPQINQEPRLGQGQRYGQSPRPVQEPLPAAYDSGVGPFPPPQDPGRSVATPPPEEFPPRQAAINRPAVPDAPVQGGPIPSQKIVPCEGAMVVAQVGREVVLYREVSEGVDRVRQQYKDKIGSDELEAQIRLQVGKKLEERIEEKLLYLDALRGAPAESINNIRDIISKDYESKIVPKLMEGLKAGSRQDLNEKMQANLGITLETHRRQYIERGLGQLWLRQQVKPNEEMVARSEMLDYYKKHQEDYRKPGQARWEQLTIRKETDARKAYERLCWMGNQVQAGASFAEIAKAHSQGATASTGGVYDWTNEGSLASKVLDRALFSPQLNPGELSVILEDQDSYHIVRILERKAASYQRFEEVQSSIEKKIREKRTVDAKSTFLTRIRTEIPVKNLWEATGNRAASWDESDGRASGRDSSVGARSGSPDLPPPPPPPRFSSSPPSGPAVR
jgi:hypothetical protein